MTGCSSSLKEWRGLRGTVQSVTGGSRGGKPLEKGIGGCDGSKTGETAAVFSTGVDNRQRGSLGASCAIRLGKKWREEEKEGDGGRSTPFEVGVAARAIGGSVLGVLHGGGEVEGGGSSAAWAAAAGQQEHGRGGHGRAVALTHRACMCRLGQGWVRADMWPPL
jgi:hypothetical protein